MCGVVIRDRDSHRHPAARHRQHPSRRAPHHGVHPVTPAPYIPSQGPVAQRSEQRTHNPSRGGSNPPRPIDMRSGADPRQVAPLRAFGRTARDRGSPRFAALRRGSQGRQSQRSHGTAWESQRRSHTLLVAFGGLGAGMSWSYGRHPGSPGAQPAYPAHQRSRARLSRRGESPSEARRAAVALTEVLGGAT
jgi:hypothetical protein